MKCKKCGENLNREWKLCPACGEQIHHWPGTDFKEVDELLDGYLECPCIDMSKLSDENPGSLQVKIPGNLMVKINIPRSFDPVGVEVEHNDERYCVISLEELDKDKISITTSKIKIEKGQNNQEVLNYLRGELLEVEKLDMKAHIPIKQRGKKEVGEE